MAGYIGSKASVVSSGAERKKVFAITTTTTSLTGLVYTPNLVHVFHNGIRLVDGTDYTATNGTTITLTNAAQNGDEVVVVSYATFQTSDTVSASAGGTFSNDLAINGDLTVDSNTLYVDSANNRVGVGTTTTTGFDSGADDLIVGSGSASTGMTIYSGITGYGSLHFADANSSPANYVGYVNYNHSTNSMQFATASTEAMRIDSSGNLLVGTTVAPSSSSSGCSIEDGAMRTSFGAYTGAGIHLYFINGNGTVGTISSSGSSTSYNTSSDYRLKEDVRPMVGASDLLMALKPVNFAWKVGGSRVDGFLAHEAQEVVPEAVHGTKDAMREEQYEVSPAVYDEDGNVVTEAVMGTREVPDYQGIDQSKLVPLLTAALQEALTEIAALKTRVTALEGN